MVHDFHSAHISEVPPPLKCDACRFRAYPNDINSVLTIHLNMARGNCGNDIVLVAFRRNAGKYRLIIATGRRKRVPYVFVELIGIVRKTFTFGRRPQRSVDNCTVMTVVGIHLRYAELVSILTSVWEFLTPFIVADFYNDFEYLSIFLHENHASYTGYD